MLDTATSPPKKGHTHMQVNPVVRKRLAMDGVGLEEVKGTQISKENTLALTLGKGGIKGLIHLAAAMEVSEQKLAQRVYQAINRRPP